MVGVETVDKARVRTGFERTLAHRVNRDFAGIAEQDGTVTKLDLKLGVVEVKYKDNSTDVFRFGHKYVEFEGFNIDHDILPLVKQGQKFKKGNIITYNKKFFNVDKATGQLDFSIGVAANVAFMEIDVNAEDASIISRRLSQKLTFKPVNSRIVVLSKNSLIHKSAQVGDHITSTDDLLIFEETTAEEANITQDEETLALLGDFNRKTPSAKFTGEVVKIEAFYGCEVKDIHPTLRAIVQKAISQTDQIYKATRGTRVENDFPKSAQIKRGVKYKGVMFDEDTVMLIYYIQESLAQGTGDKLVVMNQCKSVVTDVMEQPMFTESGEEIDVIFSASAVGRRLVLSPIAYGLVSRTLKAVERQVCKLYFGK